MQLYTAVAVLGLASLAASAPAGTLEGVVDGVAPITAGLGTTLNNLLGFKDTPGSSSGGNSGSSGNKPSGGSSSNSGNGSSSGSNSGSGGSSGGGSALLGGVVDGVAPITGGLGQTLNEILGFH
ncbi:hypothetical protein EV181_000113 [Coemansia sp. RSA 532]|nr:hypothetical protein EV181_000113 [Coemansia sp. RSA 532]KAJ2279269.1 hypothetical protein J3F81_000016 [Coemansia sp. RSA 371]